MPPTTRKASTTKKTTATRKRTTPRVGELSSQANSNLQAAVAEFGATWIKGDAKAPTEFTLPSGAVCLVKRIEPTDLITSGVLDNLDVLSGLVNEEVVQVAKKGKKPQGLLEGLPSGDALVKMLELADKVTCAVVVAPVVKLAPIPKCLHCDWEGTEEEIPEHGTQGTHKRASAKYQDHEFVDTPRDPNAIYTDGVPMTDKVAILNFVLGGANALAPFREGPGENVAAVGPVPNLPGNSG
jgi:hypothetical protein